MLVVEPIELLRIEDRIAAADAVEGERVDHLGARHYLAIAARRPSEQTEKIHHRFRDVPHPLIYGHRRRAMPFAEPLLVGAEDERHVRECRRLLAECAVQQQLLWGI